MNYVIIMTLWEMVLLLSLANIFVYSVILPVFLKGKSKHVKITMSIIFIIFLAMLVFLILYPNIQIAQLLVSPLYFFILAVLITVFSFVFIFLISLIIVWLHDRYL